MVLKTAPIGVFLREHFFRFATDQYRQHRFLRTALGKNWCKSLRNPQVLLRQPQYAGSCCLEIDYMDRCSCGYNRAAQSEEMGTGERNIGAEGHLYYLHNPLTDKVECHWISMLADEKQQDARTTFFNRCKFVELVRQFGDNIRESFRQMGRSNGLG